MINQVMARHGLPALAVSKNPKTGQPVAVRADTYVAYPLLLRKGVKYNEIVTLLPEIQSVVGTALKSLAKLRIGYYPFSLEVPVSNPTYTTLDLNAHPAQPFVASIGRAYVFGKQQECQIDLTDSNQAHVFIGGMIGCGKSITLEDALCTLAYNTSPDLLKVYLIDMKRRSIAKFEGLPHVVASAYDELAALTVCKEVFDELMRRKNAEHNGASRVLLMIDELRELKYAKADILDNWLPRIVALGRELGVHVFAATQRPSAAELGPIVNAMFPVRICGVVEGPVASYQVLQRKQAGAETLHGKGDMLLSKIGADPIRMQTFLVENPERLVAQISARWPGMSNRQHVDASRLVVPPMGNVKASALDELVVKARPTFDQLYDPGSASGLVFGGKTKLAEAMFGKGVKLVGHWQRMTNDVLEVLLNERAEAISGSD